MCVKAGETPFCVLAFCCLLSSFSYMIIHTYCLFPHPLVYGIPHNQYLIAVLPKYMRLAGLCFWFICATYEFLLFIFYTLIHAMLFWSPQTIIKHQQGLMEMGRGYSGELLFPFYLAACSRQKQAVAQQLRHLSRSGFTADKLLLKWMAAIVLTSREDFSLTCYRFKAFSCRAMRLKMYDLLC